MESKGKKIETSNGFDPNEVMTLAEQYPDTYFLRCGPEAIQIINADHPLTLVEGTDIRDSSK